jgi:hypothetical protein
VFSVIDLPFGVNIDPLPKNIPGNRLEVQMVIKKIIRIILSLLGLAYGILMVIASLKQGVPNYLLAAGGAAICIFSIGWLFNLRWAKIITGILLIPVGIAGSLWTIWDFFQDILFDKV